MLELCQNVPDFGAIADYTVPRMSVESVKESPT